jgi:hypothetical protein
MAKRKQKKKPPVPKLRIKHSYPPPRPDDAEKFRGIVRMLLEMGDAARTEK